MYSSNGGLIYPSCRMKLVYRMLFIPMLFTIFYVHSSATASLHKKRDVRVKTA